jgi:hypothetical protein
MQTYQKQKRPRDAVPVTTNSKKRKRTSTTVYSDDIEAFVHGHKGKFLKIDYHPMDVGPGKWVINDIRKCYIETKYMLSTPLGGYCRASYDPRVIRFPTKYGRWEDGRWEAKITLTPSCVYGNNSTKRPNTVVFTLDDNALFRRILLSSHFPTVLVDIIANYVILE